MTNQKPYKYQILKPLEHVKNEKTLLLVLLLLLILAVSVSISGCTQQETTTTKTSEYNSLKDSYTALQNQYNELKQIVDMEKSEVLVSSDVVNQPRDSYTYWTFNIDHPGYIEVNVKSSTTSKTYVMCWYNSYGVNYKQSIDVGDSGVAYFPVLPGTVYVAVGNYNILSGATETVSITYYY